MPDDRKAHWQQVYTAKSDDSVSWFEESPALSVSLIASADPARGSAIDIGGGASRMPEALLALGFDDVACLDISAAALEVAQLRMGGDAERVSWIVPISRNGCRTAVTTCGMIGQSCTFSPHPKARPITAPHWAQPWPPAGSRSSEHSRPMAQSAVLDCRSCAMTVRVWQRSLVTRLSSFPRCAMITKPPLALCSTSSSALSAGFERAAIPRLTALIDSLISEITEMKGLTCG